MDVCVGLSRIQILHLATVLSSDLKVADGPPPSVALILYGTGSEDPRSKTRKKKNSPPGRIRKHHALLPTPPPSSPN